MRGAVLGRGSPWRAGGLVFDQYLNSQKQPELSDSSILLAVANEKKSLVAVGFTNGDVYEQIVFTLVARAGRLQDQTRSRASFPAASGLLLLISSPNPLRSHRHALPRAFGLRPRHHLPAAASTRQ